MKRLVLYALAVGFGFLVVVVSALSVGQERWITEVGAQESDEANILPLGEYPEGMMPSVGESSGSESAVPIFMESFPEMGVAKSDYYLPYPGLLPDHPFYFLKVLRDKIRLVATRDLESKAEYALLCADKRIGAALVLAEGGKGNLAAETSMKAQQYLLQAHELSKSLSDTGVNERVGRAAVKHMEVLEGVMERLEGGELKLAEEAESINARVLRDTGIVDEVGEESSQQNDFGESEIEVSL